MKLLSNYGDKNLWLVVERLDGVLWNVEWQSIDPIPPLVPFVGMRWFQYVVGRKATCEKMCFQDQFFVFFKNVAF